MITMQVTGQIIKAVCCEKIVSDSINMLEIKFTFSNEWKGMTKTAQFTQVQDGTTYTYNVMLDSIGAADIPNEITHGIVFISVFGVLGEKRMTTAPMAMPVEKSGYISDGDTPIPPTPDLYQQIIDLFNTGLAGKAASNHTHNQNDIAGLVTALSKRDRAANLLDNSYFRKPVNTRGKTAYTGAANAYTIDRWFASTGAVSININASGVNIDNRASETANGHLTQRLEKLLDGTYTLCASTSAGMLLRTFTITNGTITTINTVNAGIAFTAVGYNEAGVLTVQIGVQAGNVITAYWAALYEGIYTAETVPTIMWEQATAEMLECKQYAVSLGGAYRHRATHITSSAIDFCIPLPVQMRTIPTFNESALTLYALSGGAMTQQEGFAFAIFQSTPEGLVIRATKTGHGLTDAILTIAANTIFSADL